MTSISFDNGNSGLQVGINHGSIYLSSERPEPRPEPLSTVPFPHDPDFVSRDALLDRVHKKVSIAGTRIALVGLGGVGKTRLAAEYCHRVRQQSTDTWVFWLHASNTARCDKSLRDLADRAKIPGRQDRNANIFQLVGNWLQDENIGRWILVLDNVDDDELLHIPSPETQANAQSYTPTQPPLRYLLVPESSNGSIIITSRNKGVALDITGHKRNLIDVQPMNMTEALVLLQNKLDVHKESPDMVQLVEELEFMPLAIVQAASYITHRLPRCSVSQYLEELRKSDRQAIKILNHESGQIHRDWEAKNSILLTWQISFEHIRRTRQSAADLLSLMAFFDPQGIPEKLLRDPKNERMNPSLIRMFITRATRRRPRKTRSSESDLNDEFEKDITTLRDYSFISTDEDSTVFTMHRLVQLTARAWLTTQGQMEQWKEKFIGNLSQEFPTGEYENWESCRKLFPHVKLAISQRPESKDSQREWATLLYKGAWYASKMGNVSDAREMASKSRKQRVVVFGADSEEALNSTAMLAWVYRLEGRWEEAERLQVQVMETNKTKLGEDHPDTLASVNSLALTYSDQGRWKEAEKLQAQVMETRKTKLGEDHPSTLASINNLASTYRDQGRWEEAEKLQVQLMETNKTKLGEDHPDTLISMNNLAMTYRRRGRWENAEKLQMQVMKTRKTKLGEDHPSTLASINNLALTYGDQGLWKEAEKLQVQLMETSKTKLGEDHPDTLISMNNLAMNYIDQGRWEEAEKLSMQVMETSKTKLGKDHPDMLASVNSLALTYRGQGRWKEAENLSVQVIETRKTKLGEDHPDTLQSMANLALTYRGQGRWKEAEKLQVKVMEMSKIKLGEDHPDTLTSMANLAVTWKSSDNTVDAIILLRDCFGKQKYILGPNHPHTISNSETLRKWETDEIGIISSFHTHS